MDSTRAVLLPVTPLFPQFTHLFNSQLRSIQSSSASTIHQLAALFDRWIPAHLLSQADEGPHSRQRRWPFRLVLWTASWQFAQAGASCRTAIRQAQAWCLQSNQTPPSLREQPLLPSSGRFASRTTSTHPRSSRSRSRAGRRSQGSLVWTTGSGHRRHHTLRR